MKTIHCFYHTDNDGHCSQYWVDQWISRVYGNDADVKKHPINYDIPFPIDEIVNDDIVTIVDFSIFPDMMLKLLEKTKHIIWIDHHKSAIDRYNGFPHEIPGIRVSGVAGCCLSWYYFEYSQGRSIRSQLYDPGELSAQNLEKMGCPLGTVHIGDYDIWAYEHPYTRAFITAIGHLNDTDPDKIASVCTMCSSAEYYELIRTGEHFLKLTEERNASICKNASDVILSGFPDLKCVALNAPGCNSTVFDSITEPYDVYIRFHITKRGYNYSFYSKDGKTDCAKIAEHFGGGGHFAAAGANTDNLIFQWR